MNTRRETLLRILLVFFVSLLSSGCTDPPPLLDNTDYAAWDRTTDRILDFPVPGHGSGLRVIFADPRVFEQPLDANGDVHYPTGSIFVKEVYPTPNPATDDQPAMLLAMVKAPEDTRSRGGWIWLTRDRETGQETIFEDEFCVTCHTNANEAHPYGTQNVDGAFRDYVFHTPALEASSGLRGED